MNNFGVQTRCSVSLLLVFLMLSSVLAAPAYFLNQTEEEIFCPECGAKNPKIANYCTTCGFSLSSLGSEVKAGADPLADYLWGKNDGKAAASGGMQLG